MQWLKKIKAEWIALGLWAITITGALGSLAFSTVFGFVPCELCWYQRAMMFPLPFIVGAAVYLKDKNLAYYVVPLALTGAVIAAYHLLLQWGVIANNVVQCMPQIPCDERYLNLFGFITIPFLSLLGFISIAGLAYAHYRLSRD